MLKYDVCWRMQGNATTDRPTEVRIGRIQREKIRVSRCRILPSAMRALGTHFIGTKVQILTCTKVQILNPRLALQYPAVCGTRARYSLHWYKSTHTDAGSAALPELYASYRSMRRSRVLRRSPFCTCFTVTKVQILTAVMHLQI
jgi:hypothetical protein